MATVQYHGLGRRKTSVARAYLRPGNGKWEVNGRSIEDYFPRPSLQLHAQEPLAAVEQQDGFDVKINVDGGGNTGQAGAVRLAVARALLSFDPELRSLSRFV